LAPQAPNEKNHLRTRLTDGSTVEFDSEPLASGGEKIVFFTKDKQHVVAFFFGYVNDPGERRRRLEKILGAYNPTIGGAQADYWRKHFCWPVGIIDNDTALPADFIKRHNIFRPVLGVVVPVYRSNFFFKDRTGNTREKKGRWFTGVKSRKLVPEDERGTLLSYLQCCSVMASAVRRLHFAGLAHSDLSHNNVLIDPKNGDACLIDCDSLVVPGFAPPTVMGTPGYIAPEVVAGKKQPSIETDQHALAVLIYESLLLRHPLAGPKVRSTRSSEEDDRLSMGEKAIYVEHPLDASNYLSPAPEISVSRLGPYLQNLFTKTFVSGLHAPNLRASAGEWEKGLQQTLDLVHPSPDGRNWFVLAKGMPFECPFSKQKWKEPVPSCNLFRKMDGDEFVNEDYSITVWAGKYLYDWHFFANTTPLNSNRKPLAYFAAQKAKWYLVNQSEADMWLPDSSERVAHGKGVVIQQGLKVLFSEAEGGRLAIFDMLLP
jgi:serine/threonine protein kinase